MDIIFYYLNSVEKDMGDFEKVYQMSVKSNKRYKHVG